MKPDYKNWVPKGMVYGVTAGLIVSLTGLFVFGVMKIGGVAQKVLMIIFAVASLVTAVYTVLCWMWYSAFDYNGKRRLSKQIIEGVAAHVTLPEGGIGLDVGCGSGALAIACAKRNPQGKMQGIDRWGKEYASFSKTLCENNAKAEGIDNVSFSQGDATHLDFPDETFDAVTSNYVYHNITGADKQKLLLETLRVLKKGGTFAIHDLMSPARYGDMDSFEKLLKDQGYDRVERIDTTDGMFMSKGEARRLMLSGSTLLVGKK